MKIDVNKMYVVEGDTVAFLERLAKRLYAPQPMTGDERRDWANDLYNVHLHSRFVEYDPRPNDKVACLSDRPNCKVGRPHIHEASGKIVYCEYD